MSLRRMFITSCAKGTCKRGAEPKGKKTMFAEKGHKPWWEQFEITIHFEGGQLRTRCGQQAPLNSKKRHFLLLGAPAEILQLAEANGAAEVHSDGTKYRIHRYRVVPGLVEIHGEPVGTVGVTASTSAKHPIQDQILEALRGSPGSMTAVQIAENARVRGKSSGLPDSS